MAVLQHGTRLGAYEVLAAIGAGGMGEVYRARDGRLNRDIALKVLPELFSLDPDRLARFKREAQVLASLNHPNIAGIYGFEESNGVQALVLELVDGPTLADRIALGPIPLDEALPLARQIAEGLEAAHEHGIIHRDLKPANIKVRPDGTVKLLDFGLAKALDPVEISGATATVSPTITSPALTQMGVILGTAAYMSPEQVKGRQADKRSDVWAFGLVLYEMLTGRQEFKGDDVPDTLAAVLRQDIDLTALPASTPAAVRRLVARCLDRDVRRRLRDIGEARIALDDPDRLAREAPDGAASGLPGPWWRRAIPLALTALVAGTLAATAAWYLTRQPSPAAPVTRFSIPLPDGQVFVGAAPRHVIALSPDGAQLVYAANTQLFRRSMADFNVQAIAGTEHNQGVTDPVFSPDGQSLIFYATESRTIKKVPIGGGAVVTICAAATPYGMSWGSDGVVFGQGIKGIMRVAPEAGSTPSVLAKVKDGEEAHGPQLLPGGEHVLYTIATGNDIERWDRSRIVVQSVTSGEPDTLIEGGSDARYLPTGHLVFTAEGTLFAVPFDVERRKVTGGRTPMVEDVRWSGGRTTGASQFSISSTGALVYLTGFAAASRQASEIVLADRQGNVERLLPAGRYFSPPRISPDGARIAFGTDDGKEAVIYVYPLSGTSSMQRITFGGNNRFPIWFDSQQLAFQSDREGDLAIWRSGVGGSAERLTRPGPGESHAPEAWSPKADVLLFSVTKGSDISLWTFSPGDGKVSQFGGVRSVYPTGARFSPDGRWVAYATRERESTTRVYVQPFPATGEKHELFVQGANAAPHKVAWSHDMKELFYVPRILEFEAVSITTTPAFAFGNAVRVPRPFQVGAPNGRTLFDVTPSGKFVGLFVPGQGTTAARVSPSIQVVLNWFEELRARVPSAN